MKTNIDDIESDFVLTNYKSKDISDTCMVYAPYIPNRKYITEDKNEWCTTFTFVGYDSHTVAAWANDSFGQTTYDLKGTNFIKIYLTDPDQITALKLAWQNV
jgi:hypothetical protein